VGLALLAALFVHSQHAAQLELRISLLAVRQAELHGNQMAIAHQIE
jgi:hypothetical protein